MLQVFAIRGSRRQNMMYRITRLRKMLVDICSYHTTSIGGQPGGPLPTGRAAPGKLLTMRMMNDRLALSGSPWICSRKMSW